MRALALFAAAAALVVTAGCVDFDAAENSFCNHTLLEKRVGICGSPRIAAMAPLASGELWLTGDNKVTIGTAPLSFVARSDEQGALPVIASFRGYTTYFNRSDVHALDVATSPAGEALVVGTFQGGVSFTPTEDMQSAGQLDSFLVRVSPEGQVTHMRQLGVGGGGAPAQRVIARAIAARTGQVVIAGEVTRGSISVSSAWITADSSTRAFVFGMDEKLAYRWHATTTGCALSVAEQVTFDGAGNVYVLARAQGAGCSFGAFQPLAAQTEDAPAFVVARYPAAPASSPAEPDWAVRVSPAVGATEGCLAVSDAGLLTAATPWGYDLEDRASSTQLQVIQLTAATGEPTEEQALFVSADGIACRSMVAGASGKTYLAADFDSPHLATSDKPSPWEIRPGPNAIALELSPSLGVDSLRRYQGSGSARAAGIVVHPGGEAALVGSFEGRLDVDLTGEALDASEMHWGSHIFVLR